MFPLHLPKQDVSRTLLLLGMTLFVEEILLSLCKDGGTMA